MEALYAAVLKFLYDRMGVGVAIAAVAVIASTWYDKAGSGIILSVLAIVAAVWVTWHAKVVLDGVAAAINRMAASQEAANALSTEQQRLCRCHAESQETLVDSMRSLVQEVHVSATSGARVQEMNMRAVLDVLQHVLDRNQILKHPASTSGQTHDCNPETPKEPAG